MRYSALTENHSTCSLSNAANLVMQQLEDKPQEQTESSNKDLSSLESSEPSPATIDIQQSLGNQNAIFWSSLEWPYDVSILPTIHESYAEEEEAFNRAFDECFESPEEDWGKRFEQFLKTYAQQEKQKIIY